MNTLQLKKAIIQEIDLLNDLDILQKIRKLLNKNSKEAIYSPSKYESESIQISIDQASKGKIISNKEVFDDAEKWLSSK